MGYKTKSMLHQIGGDKKKKSKKKNLSDYEKMAKDFPNFNAESDTLISESSRDMNMSRDMMWHEAKSAGSPPSEMKKELTYYDPKKNSYKTVGHFTKNKEFLKATKGKGNYSYSIRDGKVTNLKVGK